MRDETLISKLGDISLPLADKANEDLLVKEVGEAQVVMLGEASHGTKEYYLWRNRISMRLLEEKNFNFIAVEGDWPDCYQINKYIKNNFADDIDAEEMMKVFDRWPTWMWANEEVLTFVEWLEEINLEKDAESKIGFFGLDIYSLWQSLEAVIKYLRHYKPSLLNDAYKTFHCFGSYGHDIHAYASMKPFLDKSCEEEVIHLLSVIRREWGGSDEDKETYFNAEQNALVVKNAEHYYRTMLKTDVSSWNIRDRAMFDTMERLLRFHDRNAKVIVWAHNTHIGDARYTKMKENGLINIGQLAREKYGDEKVKLIGFGSYMGSVLAARSWDGAMQEMVLPSAIEGSFEDILHKLSPSDQLLIFSPQAKEDIVLNQEIPHRAVGVVYHPENEYGNYVPSVIPKRYDAFLYFDMTSKLDALEISRWDKKEISETYPSGF